MYACAANCIDGRVQEPVIKYLKERCGVRYIDMVTEAGINLILAERNDPALIESIQKRMDISIRHHKAISIAIVGHPDCGGNPAGREEQIEHLRLAAETVMSFDFQRRIHLLWVEDNQRVEAVGIA